MKIVVSVDPFQQWQYAVYAWNAGATDATCWISRRARPWT
jgi:hypothetical protein